MKVIGRQEAIKQGLLRYFTGKPCLRGHISERAVSHRGCLSCHSENQDPAKARVNGLRYERQNREARRARLRKENIDPEKYNKILEYFRIKNQERRDFSIGQLTPYIILDLFDEQDGKCVACGIELGDNFHLDHIVPLSRGGLNVDSNVQLLCPSCNLSKGNKTMQEWKS